MSQDAPTTAKKALVVAILSLTTASTALVHAADRYETDKHRIQQADLPLKDDWLGNSIVGAAANGLVNAARGLFSGVGAHVSKETAYFSPATFSLRATISLHMAKKMSSVRSPRM